jgi:predicted metalloenzyme YecM
MLKKFDTKAEMKFHSEAHLFLEKLNKKLDESNIFLESNWHVDHLCYRVSTIEKYQDLKVEFQEFSKLLVESEVNGRMISTYKLAKPIHFGNSSISIVELPAPKPGKVTIEGFEHVEVVSDLSFKELESKYKHIKIDKTGLNKKINQELELCLGEINLKFHPLSLESLINLENNKKVWDALEQSQVLAVLKEYNPLIAGTYPLGLQVEDSDLDILIRLKDKKQLIELAQKSWGSLTDFNIEETQIDKLETLIVKFRINTIPFEIFAQDNEPVRQKAYLHFLVEERLLNELGTDFRSLVMRLRKQGLKTEPAFAQALNLSGDPYLALLDLQRKAI